MKQDRKYTSLKSHYSLGAVLLLGMLATGRAQDKTGEGSIDGVYRGILGKQEIVLEIGEADDKQKGDAITGRYFYRQHGVAIFVKGARLEDGGVRLQEYQPDQDHSSLVPTGAEWHLKFNGGHAVGFFCKCDVRRLIPATFRKLNLSLTRVSKGFDPRFGEGNSKSVPDQAYYDLLLDFPLHDRPEVSINDEIAYTMRDDPRFKSVSVPQLTRFPDAKVIAKVNQSLTERLRKLRLSAAQYIQGEGFMGGDFQSQDRITFLTRDLLNVVGGSSYYSAGMAHPEYSGLDVLTYDLHTGESFDFTKYFEEQIDPAFLKKYTEATEKNGKGDSGDQDSATPAGLLVVDLYLRYYAPSAENAEQCSRLMAPESKEWMANELGPLWPEATGLVISQSPDALSHVAIVCARDVVVPYSEVLPLLMKDSALRPQFSSPPVSDGK